MRRKRCKDRNLKLTLIATKQWEHVLLAPWPLSQPIQKKSHLTRDSLSRSPSMRTQVDFRMYRFSLNSRACFRNTPKTDPNLKQRKWKGVPEKVKRKSGPSLVRATWGRSSWFSTGHTDVGHLQLQAHGCTYMPCDKSHESLQTFQALVSSFSYFHLILSSFRGDHLSLKPPVFYLSPVRGQEAHCGSCKRNWLFPMKNCVTLNSFPTTTWARLH